MGFLEAFLKRSDKVLFGFLGALALLVLLCAACIAGLVVLPARWWTRSGPMEASKTFLASNPTVIEKVGRIRRFGWVPSGSFHEADGRGRAHLTLSLEGEKGEAKATVDLTKEAGGDWKVRSATLFKDGRTFILTGADTGEGPPEEGRPAPPPPDSPPVSPGEKDPDGLPA